MNDRDPNGGEPFPPEALINASELREFLFCERAWFLSRQGHRVSAEAESQRTAGIIFHEQRAAAANRGRRPQAYWWAAILALAAIALILVRLLMGGQ